MFKEFHFRYMLSLGSKNFSKSLLILSYLLVFSASCKNSYTDHYQQEVDSIAAKFVPDNRLGICNIKIKYGENGTVILLGETTNLTARNEIIKTLYKSGKSLIDSIVFLPDTVRNRKFMGLVNLSVINLRREPDHPSELVSQAILGTPVLILKNLGSWVLIQTPDKYIAWTEASSVKPVSIKELSDWKKAKKVIYMESTGWLHEHGSNSSGVVCDLVGGSILEMTGESNGYAELLLPDGRKGYAEKRSFMDFEDWKKRPPCTEESTAMVAMTYLGVPYLWGGSSIKGVDCSGFVQSVYFRNGLILLRDASLQALNGIPVDVSNGYSKLRKGDLLFFGSIKNGKSHVTHVAFYLENNEYINSAGRVLINSFDSTQINFSRYRKNSFLAAKRVIGVEGDTGIIPVSVHPWY